MLRLLGQVQCHVYRLPATRPALALRRASASLSAPTTEHPKPLQLRPYQKACVQACLGALKGQETTRIGVSMPTGSGKTVVFIALIAALPPPPQNPAATRALIIVNSIELARQVAGRVKSQLPHLSVEIEQGKHEATGEADVTVALYRSLRDEKMAKFDTNKLKCVIVDEAHHAVAPSYLKILSRLNAGIRHPDQPPPKLSHPIPIIGFSATFSRHDGLALGSVFQDLVFHIDFLAMVKGGWLCDVRYTEAKTELNLDRVAINPKLRDFDSKSLAHAINNKRVNKLVVQSWLDKCSSRRSTLVFCVNVTHLKDLTDAFQQADVDARCAHSKTPYAERKELVDAFKAGEFPVLLNVAIFTEGTDIPNIDCVVIVRPTQSKNLFSQMIGRGMRLSPQTGKDDCHIMDFVDNTHRISGIISIPTLVGVDPNSSRSLQDREDPLLVVPYDNEGGSDPPPVAYVDYKLSDLVREAQSIKRFSRFAWVDCGNDIYVLECSDKGYIKIEPVTNDDAGELVYRSSYVEALRENPSDKLSFEKPREVMTARSLNEVARNSDNYAVTRVFSGKPGADANYFSRTAKWRQNPASDSQKDVISKKGYIPMLDLSVDIESMTKGQAADIFTRSNNRLRVRKLKPAYIRSIALSQHQAWHARKPPWKAHN
ncbi:P-loop containing nucleoside triphosphate hydrolase protein [Phellopilus nigrolimitatus]|nr:P-loop containing nucleoside triphosphate hydrolase protein [Phellopilus nigrolimitatus]